VDRGPYLERIAARLGHRRGAPVPLVPGRRPGPTAPAAGDALLRLFVERLGELGGEAVAVAGRAEAQAAVERLLAERGYGALDCPAGLRWPGVEALCGPDPAAADFGLSEARWAVAETGSVVLWHDDDRPRGSSLVPPAVGFFVPVSGLVPRLGDVTSRLAAAGLDLPACVTVMTGPSRSMDIGYVSCMGVHGPGQTTVWLLADE
jgi:L-lactate dehydrogenase complex protein LldG